MSGFALDGKLTGSTGDDTIELSHTAIGSSVGVAGGDDSITAANSTGTTFDGGDGNDTIGVERLNSESVINGGAGSDEINVEKMASSSINGGADDDIINVTKDGDGEEGKIGDLYTGTINGDAGNDSITVDRARANSVINGGEGADSINVGYIENSSIDGGADNDQISVETIGEEASIDGGAGADTVYLTTEVNNDVTIKNTGSEADHLIIGSTAGSGNITLESDAGFVVASSVTDTSAEGEAPSYAYEGLALDNKLLNGSAGADTFYVASLTNGADIEGGAGADSIKFVGNGADSTNTITDSYIRGGDGDDSIDIVSVENGTTNTSNNYIYGDAGNDTINIELELTDSSIYGGDGADSIVLSAENVYSLSINGDALVAQTGNDTIDITGTASGVLINGFGGNDVITVDNLKSTFGSVAGSEGEESTIFGGAGDDSITIIDTSESSWIYGDDGADTITVTSMTSTYDESIIRGGAGADSIKVTTATDGSVYGDEGDDTIDIGEATAEFRAYGGEGNDSITIDSLTDSSFVYGGAGDDTIKVTTAEVFDVYGDAGNDLISLGTVIPNRYGNNFFSGSVDGGEGSDTIKFTEEVPNSKLSIKNSGLVESDYVFFEAGLANGATVDFDSINLKIEKGFVIASSYDAESQSFAKLDLDGNTLIASMGADTFHLADVTDSEVNGNGGNDSISIETASNAQIISGVESINVTEAEYFTNGEQNNEMPANYSINKDGSLTISAGAYGELIVQLNGNWEYIKPENLDPSITTVTFVFIIDGFYFEPKIIIADENTYNGDIRSIDFTGEDNDTVNINTATNGTSIETGIGDDTITVGNGDDTTSGLLDGSSIDAGDGNDSIFVSKLANADDRPATGEIDGGAGDDTITVLNANGGSINGDDGDDNIIVTSAINEAEINGGAGDDSIHVGDSSDDTSDFVSSTINAGEGADNITVTTLNGSTINGGDGADLINVARVGSFGDYDAVINGDAGADSIYVGNGDDTTTGLFGSTINGGADNDTITVTVAGNVSTINGDAGDDSITISNRLSNSDVNGGVGGDTISVDSADGGEINAGEGNDSIDIKGLDNSTVKGEDGDDTISIDISFDSTIIGGDGNDSITVDFVEQSSINGGEGSDSISLDTIVGNATITNEGVNTDHIFLQNGLNNSLTLTAGSFGEEDSYEEGGGFVVAKSVQLATDESKDTYTGFDLVDGGSITGSAGADTFYINSIGVGVEASDINLGAGDDRLVITKNSSDLTDSELARLVTENEGADTLEINWAFNGTFDASNGDVLISKGLGPDAQIIYGDSDDRYESDVAISNNNFAMSGGNDTVSLYAATNVNINTTRAYNAGEAVRDADDVHIDTTLTNSTIVTGVDADEVFVRGAVKGTFFDLGTSTTAESTSAGDTIAVGSLDATSSIRFNADGLDFIQITGAYNDGMVLTQKTLSGGASETYAGIATGDDGGVAILSTWGTGNIQLGYGADTLHIFNAFSGVNGLKDIDAKAGHDTLNLSSVSGAAVRGGAGEDSIFVTSLTATASIYGGADDDTLRFGTDGLDTVARPVITTMSAGLLDGGAGDDRIIIGNSYKSEVDGTLYGTMSGGRVEGGDGNDTIATGTLGGSAIMNGGDGADEFIIANMSGGTLSTGNGVDNSGVAPGSELYNTVEITTMSGGTINGGADEDKITIGTTSGRAVVNGGAGADTFSGNIMNGGTVNGGDGADDINMEDMKNGTINGDDGADSIYISGEMSGGTINGGADNDNIAASNMRGGTINGNDGADSIYIFSEMSGGTINGGADNDNIVASSMTAGTINGNDGTDTITINGDMTAGTINGNDGTDTITINGEMSGGTINAGDYVRAEGNAPKMDDTINITTLSGRAIVNDGSGDDQVYITNMTGGTVNNGAGYDAFIINTMTGGSIKLGAGGNTLNITGELSGGSITGGNGNDKLFLYNNISLNAGYSINLGGGLNHIIVFGDLQNEVQNEAGETSLVSQTLNLGSGNDNVEIVEVDQGGLLTGNLESLAGHVKLGTGSDTITVASVVDGGSITYTNAGQDHIIIAGIYNGTGIDDGVAASDLSTGSDGGYIELGNWVESQADGVINNITFGNGNDTFVLTAGNSSLANDINLANGNDKFDLSASGNGVNKLVDLGTGSDTVHVNSIDVDAGGNIKYNNAGQDHIIINGEYDGTGVDDGVAASDLSTGTDGGKIELGSWTGGTITFGNGHDTFVLRDDLANHNAEANAHELEFMSGNDSIQIDGALAGSITYDNRGLDTIKLNDYDGVNIENTYNKDSHAALSTGTDGGKIELDSWTSGAISFGKGNDTFVLHNTLTKDIDLGTGNDAVTLNGLGEVINGEGAVISIGKIIYDDKGFDSITINGAYTSNGFDEDGNALKLTTGTDGGFIHVNSLATGGINNLEFGAGNDHFSISNMDLTGAESIAILDLGAGNDSLTLGILSNRAGGLTSGTVDLGIGNNVVLANAVDSSAMVMSNSGADSMTVTYLNGIVHAGSGNNVINATNMSLSASIVAGNGADKITVDSQLAGEIRAGDGNNTIVVNGLVSASGKIVSGIGNDSITVQELQGNINAGNGNNRIEIDKLSSSGTNSSPTITSGSGADSITMHETAIALDGQVATIDSGAGNDTFNLTLNGNITVNGGAGLDRFTIESIDAANTVNGGNDNDTFIVNKMVGELVAEENKIVGGTLNGDAGNDSFTITDMQGGTVNGGEGLDRVIITHMSAGTINGNAGNDSMLITNVTGTTTISGDDGNDTITVTNFSALGTVDGGAGNDRLTVTNMDGYRVNGGAGSDIISVTTLNDGDISGEGDADSITVVTMNGGAVHGGDSDVTNARDDSITITTMNAGRVEAGSGNDSIKITTINGEYGEYGEDITTTVDAGDGNDTLVVTTAKFAGIDGGAGDDSMTVTTAIDSEINGGNGNDTINSTTANRSSYDGGAGNDSITIGTAYETIINGGDDASGAIVDDRIKVTTLSDNSSIYAGSGNDSITVTTHVDSKIFGDAGDDTFNISTATRSEVHGGDGDDSIKIITATESKIYGGNDDDNDGNDTITITTARDNTIEGRIGDDSIHITTAQYNIIDGGDGDDTITVVTSTDNIILGGAGDDKITVTTLNADNDIDLGTGNDSLYIAKKGSGVTDDDLAGFVVGNDNVGTEEAPSYMDQGRDTLSVNWAFNGTFTADAKDDANGLAGGDVLMTKGLGANAILNFSEGNDGLYISGAASGNKSGLSDSDLAAKLAAGQDTLSVGWAFNGTWDAGNDGGTLITKGLGATALADGALTFGSGNDGFISTAAVNGKANDRVDVSTLAGNDTVELVSTNYVDIKSGADNDDISINGTATNTTIDLGEGADTFSVNSMGAGSTLLYDAEGVDHITIKGTLNDGMVVNGENEAVALSTGSDGGAITLDTWGSGGLEFGIGSDTLTITKALSGTASVYKNIDTDGNGALDADLGDKVELLSARWINVNTGAGDDTVIVKSTLSDASVSTVDGDDQITIGGAVSNVGIHAGVDFSDSSDNDSVTINNNISNSTVNTGVGDDTIKISGTVTNTQIDAGTGADNIELGSLGAGSRFMHNADSSDAGGVDSVKLSGTFNDNMVQTQNSAQDGIFYGLATGNDGGKIELATWGTGNLLFSEASDTISITGAINGKNGLNDVFTLGGNDIITLASVSGADIHGGDGTDVISASSLTATGALYGDTGNDTLRIGREGLDTVARPVVATMTAGLIDGGADNVIFVDGVGYLDDNDTIIIGNSYNGDDKVYGTMSGGRVEAGAGNDSITTGTLSGSAMMNGGVGADTFSITTMSGGSINTGGYDASGLIKDTVKITSMTGGSINGSVEQDNIDITNMSGRAVVNGDGGDDTIIIGDITNEGEVLGGSMSGGTINGGDGNDLIITAKLSAGTINAGAGNNTIGAYNMSGGTINTGAGNDTISIVDITRVTTATMSGGTINAGAGNDTISIVDITRVTTATMSGGTINAGEGDDRINIQSLSGGTINGDAGNDRIIIANALNGGKILGGAGDDTLVLESGVTLGTGYSIDLGTGDNEIQIEGTLAGQTLTLGAAADNVVAYDALTNATINLGNGTNKLTIDGASTETKIIGGSGSDSIYINDAFNDYSNVNTGTGSDYVSATGEDSSLLNTDGTIGGTLTVDNKGQDTIVLKDYQHGMMVDAAGNIVDLSTGNDGGWIELDSWTSGDITFGNGNDTFMFDNALNNAINLGSGSDVVNINGFTAGGSITYDNKGNDVIVIDTKVFTGDEFEAGGLSTGTDGGYIKIEEVNDNNVGWFAFGNGNDQFLTNYVDVTDAGNELNLGLGNDFIYVAAVADDNQLTITYDNTGFDSIVVDKVGYVVSTNDDKLSTGAGGGSIEVGSITSSTESGQLAFSTFNDHFSVGTLNAVASEEGGDAGVIDLLTGTDSITVGTLTAGTIQYNNQGFDSITINGVYDGAGFMYDDYSSKDVVYEDGIHTGIDGGFVYIGQITADGVEKLAFGKGNDHFSIYAMDVSGGTINLEAGNDTLALGSVSGGLLDGTIDLGEGNNTVLEGNVGGGGRILSGAGNDTINLATLAGTLNAGNGNNRIEVDTLAAGGSFTTGTGADSITVTTASGSDTANASITSGVGNDTLDLTTVNSFVSVNGGAGLDKFIIDTLDGGTISGGDGNDNFTVTTMDQGTVNGDAGVDNITIINMTGGDVYGEANGSTDVGNDKITITSMSGGNVYGNEGNDIITIDSKMSGSKIEGNEGKDIITLTHVETSDVHGGADDDRIIITTMGGRALVYGEDGNDSIHVTTQNSGAISGGAGNDSITVITMNDSSELYGGLGIDRITITNMNGGIVNGGDSYTDPDSDLEISGADSITITTMNGGNVYGGESSVTNTKDDTITITTMFDGEVHANSGNDSIKITNIKGSFGDASAPTVNAGSGKDTITITEARYATVDGDSGDDSMVVTTNVEALVDGETGNDTIITTTANRATYYGGAGDDSITITTAYDTDIHGDAAFITYPLEGVTYDDTIKITTLSDHSTLNGGIGNDSITVTNLVESTLDGDAGNDSITITTATRSTISGGDGDDSIKISSLIEGLVDGGVGDDTLTLTLKTTDSMATVSGGEGADSFEIIKGANSKGMGVQITDFSVDDADTLSIGGKDVTQAAYDAIDAGETSYTDVNTGIIIYFG